jgi:hypothetical protein
MRKCILCPSHEYEYCTKCKDKSLVENWRLLFDKEECRDIYHVLSEFAFGRLTANEAKSQLDNYTLPNPEEMQPALRKNLEDVMSQATIQVKSSSKNKQDEPKKENKVRSEIKEELSNESEEEYVPSYRRKSQPEEGRVKAVRTRRSFRRNYE